jgi:DNA-binding beta-propeller fold protein YncE
MTRNRPVLRGVALALLGLASLLAAGPAQAKRPERAVLAVGNSYAGTVTFIDARALRKLGPPLNIVPDGTTPRDPRQAAVYPALIAGRGEVNYAQEVVFSPSGQQLYVSRGYLGDLAVFSVGTRRLLWRVQLPGLRADHLAISRDGRRLFATSLPGTRVYAIDTRTHRIVGSYEAGDYPHVLEFAPGDRYLYSGSLGNQLAPFGQDRGVHQLTVADPRTLRVLRKYTFEAGVRPFALAPNGKRLVLQLSYFNGFIEIDLRTGRRVLAVALPKRGPGATLQLKDYPNAAAHHGIDISHDGRTVCDAGTISNYVALVPLPAARPVRIIPVGQAPGEVITSLDSRYCFVTSRGPTGLNRKPTTNGNGDTLSVISYEQRKEVKRIRVGVHPQSETTALVPDAALKAGRFLR